MQIYEDTELTSFDLEIRRLSKINYRIPVLELLNVTKLDNGKFKIKFVNKTGNLNQNEIEQLTRMNRLIVKDSISILGRTYTIPERFDVIRDEERNMTIKLDLTRKRDSIIVNKITLIVKRGFMDECSRCNRPSTMLASDNRRYCSLECFLKKSVDLSELKVF